MAPDKPRRGLVIGCGGTLGAAWTTGVLATLPWDPRTADALVGTSAGAEFVTMLGSGVSVPEILAAYQAPSQARPELVAHLAAHPPMLPPLPRARLGSPRLFRSDGPRLVTLSGLLPLGRGDAAWLTTLADRLVPSGWIPHPAAWLVAMDYDSGARVAFGSPNAPQAPLRDAIRASWAIPGWFPPVHLAGRRYVDGGVASPTSADLLAPLGLDEVVVIAPMASTNPGPPHGLSRLERLLRTAMTTIALAEVATLRATGTRVSLITPGAKDLTAIGPNLMDHRRVKQVLETSLRTSREQEGSRTP